MVDIASWKSCGTSFARICVVDIVWCSSCRQKLCGAIGGVELKWWKLCGGAGVVKIVVVDMVL